MVKHSVWAILCTGWVLVCCRQNLELPEDVKEELSDLSGPVDYVYDVKPILSDRCFACHGPDAKNQKADLRLDVAGFAYKKETESGLKAITPGKPWRSEFVHRILSDDPDMKMPTPESHLSLTAREKAILIRWIEEGAVYKPHWAFTKVEKPRVPETGNKQWAANEIDHFILEKMEEKGFTPSPQADKITLLRRVSMDLTGLPPTAGEIENFLADSSPEAYEKTVDRLLASPRYGEHMAVAWLDAARYADTHGYQDDGPRTAWPYRDWVIKAFNENLPYDGFVTWQLAGDLLPNPTRDQLVATAFNRMHQQSQEGGIVPEEYRTAYVADRTDTFGKVFLGMSVECARCHDHKYDPISHKDYYSLFAYFNNVNENGQIPYNGESSPAITIPAPEAEARLDFIRTRLEKEYDRLRSDDTAYEERFQKWLQAAESAPEKALIPGNKDLIGYFTFDEASGKEFANLANLRHKAFSEGDDSLSNAASRPGKFGKARFMYGDNPVRFGDKFAFFERNQPFTISIWLNIRDAAIDGSLIHKSNGVMNGYRGWNVFRLPDGRIRLTISYVWPENSIEIQTVDPVPLDKWTHVAFSYDGLSKANGVVLYLDGLPVKVTVHNDGLTQSILYGKNKTNWYVDQLSIGRLSDQRTKNFEVDELKIYSRVLTPLEMLGEFSRKNELLAVLKTPREKRPPEKLAALRDYYLAHIDESYRQARAEALSLLGEETEIRNTQIDVMITKERRFPRKTYILNRGAYDAPDKEVTADTPDSFFKIPKGYPENRLGLAQWLLHEDHPLFTRVAVNRFWQSYFGNGLVVTSDDYGNQGELPTHPLLLDWLASAFRESKWDVKAMQKMIVMSSTYRQSSRIRTDLNAEDEDNRYYTRGPSYRLSAEQIRDNALASSKLMAGWIGGKSAHPYQPDGIWEALATRNEVRYRQQHGDTLYRRSLYTVWKRSAPPPMMLSFDASERHFCITKRQKTSTPLQALVVMNDPQFVEASRVLAQQALKRDNAVDRQIAHIFTALTSRPPSDYELSILRGLYQEEYDDFLRNPKRVSGILSVGEYPADRTLDAAKVAAFTMVASTVMNFDEFVIKR